MSSLWNSSGKGAALAALSMSFLIGFSTWACTSKGSGTQRDHNDRSTGAGATESGEAESGETESDGTAEGSASGDGGTTGSLTPDGDGDGGAEAGDGDGGDGTDGEVPSDRVYTLAEVKLATKSAVAGFPRDSATILRDRSDIESIKAWRPPNQDLWVKIVYRNRRVDELAIVYFWCHYHGETMACHGQGLAVVDHDQINEPSCIAPPFQCDDFDQGDGGDNGDGDDDGFDL